ncbi:unnamed protein product [Linum trigynum]|uniref:Secreted protein n=1 Tax=Linum trigynum TaxID=586398 RepID=A0AAV2GAK9_9ROSI
MTTAITLLVLNIIGIAVRISNSINNEDDGKGGSGADVYCGVGDSSCWCCRCCGCRLIRSSEAEKEIGRCTFGRPSTAVELKKFDSDRRESRRATVTL